MQNTLAAFERLIIIMDELRAKCPWDKKQTLQSLSNLTIEEVYELTDAILQNDYEEIAGELGDLFLHLVFYAKIGTELEKFTLESILNRVCDKLIERHPHIYGDTVAESEEEVKRNWEKIKLQSGKKSVLQGVPLALPALVKAYRIQSKVAGVGFEWQNINQIWEKVEEEINELKIEIEKGDQKRIEEEYGDLLFALVNYGRFLKIVPEDALQKANHKFKKRFEKMEELITKDNLSIQNLNLNILNTYWDTVKKSE
jgi:XTP/dITP diphosphohydrolase